MSWYEVLADEKRIKAGEWPPPFKNPRGKKRGVFAAVHEACEKFKTTSKKKAVAKNPQLDKLSAGARVRPEKSIVDNILAGADRALLMTFLDKPFLNASTSDREIATQSTAFRKDVPDIPSMITETESSSCLGFALNNITGSHTLESHADILALLRKATNHSTDTQLVELVSMRGNAIPVGKPMLPIRDSRRCSDDSPFWVGLIKKTISDPAEIAHLADDPLYFNSKLTELKVTRCFLAVQRSACTSIDSQHTGHIYTMKLCHMSNFWLYRDNVDGYQPTLEFDADGSNKKMSMYFSTMLNRVTRIEIYYFGRVDRHFTQQQQGPHNLATNYPNASLRQILLAAPGQPRLS